jgi:uncharacterized membrane protein
MITTFLIFVVALSWVDLSFIVPGTAFHFVLATLGSKWFLQEHISRLRWCGIILISLGVALLALP